MLSYFTCCKRSKEEEQTQQPYSRLLSVEVPLSWNAWGRANLWWTAGSQLKTGSENMSYIHARN